MRRGGPWGEEPLQDLLGFTSPWKRSPLSWGDRLGNLWSLCGLGVGKGVPASGGYGAGRGFESAARLWGLSPFLLIPTSQRRKLRPREGHSLAQDHTHIPFRASQDLTPRPSVSEPVPWGLRGMRAGQSLYPHLQRAAEAQTGCTPPPRSHRVRAEAAAWVSPPLGRQIPE